MPPSRAPRTLRADDPESCRCHGKGDCTSEIFISYRREDAPAHAGRLYDGLADEFGPGQVFMDVDTLEPGVDFVDHIRSAVGSADILLVVIGRGWLSSTDVAGGRRLDDPKDFVRLEIGLALRGSPVVIPVLVGGAAMPAEEDLPSDLALLARRNAVTLVDADWRLGLARLIAALRRIVEPVEEPEPAPAPPAVSVPPAVLATERSDAAPAPFPVLATILAIAGAVALVAGTWLQAEAWAHPSPGIDRNGLGLFTSVAPMTIAVGAVGSLLLSYSRGTARIATGLFLGFALAGVARYLSLLGVFSNTSGEEASRVVSGAWVALLGCGLLAAAAGIRIVADREQPRAGGLGIPRMLVVGGAVLVVAGTVIPFTSSEELNAQTVFERNGSWRALELIGTAAFAVAASLVLARARTVASGALIALGAFLALLWAARYVAFPVWQLDDPGSIAAGGVIGFAGGLAILVGGLRARPRERGGRTSSVRPVEGAS